MSLDSRGFGLLRRLYRNILGRQRVESGYKKTDFASMESMEPRLMMSAAPLAPFTFTIEDCYEEQQQCNFSLNFSDTDTADQHTVSVDWGDGVTTNPTVTYSEPGQGSILPSHTYSDDDQYTVTVAISDGTYTTYSYALANVLNLAPEFSTPADAVFDDGTWGFDISITDPGQYYAHNVSIDWGDGTTTTPQIAVLNGYGELSVSHTYTAGGEYTATITTDDLDGDEITQEFTVNYLVPQVDIVFALDYSGSMNDEQYGWLTEAASNLDSVLRDNGIIARYGAGKFGGTSGFQAFTFDNQTTFFTDLDTIVSTINDIEPGGQNNEDGYIPINYALDYYDINDSSSLRFVLVTDEDRDTGFSQTDYDDLLSELSDRDAVLDAIVPIQMFDENGDRAFAINSGTNAALVDEDGFSKYLISYNDGSNSLIGDESSFLIDIDLASALLSGDWDYEATADAQWEFEDITSTGTSLTTSLTMNDYAIVETVEPNNFSFTFYGQEYNSFTITENGSIHLGNERALWEYEHINNDMSYESYGDVEDMEEMTRISAFWDALWIDVDHTNPSDILWELKDDAQGKRLVVQWNEIKHDDSINDGITFQAVLYENGTIRMSYDDLDMSGTSLDNGASATVGISYLDWKIEDTDLTNYPTVEYSSWNVQENYIDLSWDTGGIAYDVFYMAGNHPEYMNTVFANWTTDSIVDQLPEIDITSTGGTTTDTTPLIEGTAEAGGTVELYANGYFIGTTTADSNGDWSIEASSAMNDGSYSFVATSTNADGYELNTSDSLAVTVAATPLVTSVSINDGDAQRHSVDTIAMTLNQTVTMTGSELELWRHNGTDWTAVDISSASFSLNGSVATWTLPTLVDGHYTAILDVSLIQDSSSNYLQGSDCIEAFHQLEGDFDGSGAQDSGDCDVVMDAIASSSTDLVFDLDSDQDIDQDDLTELVEDIFHTHYGDADFDGDVDIMDFLILKSNYGATSATWAQGDFNTTDGVNIFDFLVLKGNYGSTVDPDFDLIDLDINNAPIWS